MTTRRASDGGRRSVAPVALATSSLLLGLVIARGDSLPHEVKTLLLLGACTGYTVMFVAERRWGGLGIRFVAACVAVEYGIGMLVPPRATNDLWWYSVYGRILATHHESPYTHDAASFPRDAFMQHLGHAWRHTPSVYGPLFTGISGAVAAVSAQSLLSARLWYQGIALGASLLGAVLIWRRTRSAGAVAFFACHPVIALYVVNGGRNDVLVGVALLGAALLAIRGHDGPAGVAAGLGALIKISGLVGAVALVVAVANARGTSAARRVGLGATGTVALGYLVVGPAALLTPMDTAGALFSRGSVWKVARRLAVPSPHLALAVLAVIVVVVLLGVRRSSPDRAITATCTALTLGAAYTLAGYVAWALPSAALDHESDVSRIAAIEGVVLTAGYAVYRNPFGGPVGSALRPVAALGVPLASLLLLVALLRSVRRGARRGVPSPRGALVPQRS